MTQREAPSPEFIAAYMAACANRPADWNEIGYWYARQCWDASRRQALEEAAQAVDALRDDAKEAECHAKWRAAEKDGLSESLQLAHASFWSTVSTVNGVLGRAAKAIRSLTPTKGPTP